MTCRRFLSVRGRVGTAAVVSMLALPAFSIPLAASAAPALWPVSNGGELSAACTVTEGTLTWGLKESFRSYISGTIANGSWETSDGASYETPVFIWSEATGQVDLSTGTGTVNFKGSISFTGHDGILDLTLSNPTIELEGDGTGALLLDARSTDVQGEVVVDSEQVWFGEITIASGPVSDSDRWELLALPTKLTNSGSQAFAEFYEADAELDPIDLVLQLDGCEGVGASGSVGPGTDGRSSDRGAADRGLPTDQSSAAGRGWPVQNQPDQGRDVPWIPIGIGFVALVVIGVTVVMLVGGKKGAVSREPAG